MARVQLELPDAFVYETTLEVRITDINFGGHLGNDRMLSLIHEGRARFFRERRLSELDIEGVGIIVADAVVVYRAEAFFGDQLRFELAARDFNRYGCDLVYRLRNRETDQEIARAKTGIVFFDYSLRKVVRAPASFLTLFPNSRPG